MICEIHILFYTLLYVVCFMLPYQYKYLNLFIAGLVFLENSEGQEYCTGITAEEAESVFLPCPCQSHGKVSTLTKGNCTSKVTWFVEDLEIGTCSPSGVYMKEDYNNTMSIMTGGLLMIFSVSLANTNNRYECLVNATRSPPASYITGLKVFGK